MIVRVGLRIPQKLNRRLVEEAGEKGISKNALILIILDEWIKKDQNNRQKVDADSEDIMAAVYTK